MKSLENREIPIESTEPIGDLTELFFTIAENRVSAIVGPSNSGKSFRISRLQSLLHIQSAVTLHISPDTDFTTLVGFTDTQGQFHEGILYSAIANGTLTIFENADFISTELLQQLDFLFDSLSYSVEYPCGNHLYIHPGFHAVFISQNCLCTCPTFRTSAFTVEQIKEFAHSDSVCQHLCDFIDSGDVSLTEVMVFSDIILSEKKYSTIEVITSLFAEQPRKREFLIRFIEDCKTQALIEDDDLRIIEVILNTSAVTLLPDSSGSTTVSRGSITVSSSIHFNLFEHTSDAVKVAAFTALLSGYKSSGRPLVLLGDPVVTDTVASFLESNALTVDCSPFQEVGDLFGEVILSKTKSQSPFFNASPLSLAMSSKKSIILHHLHLLNEHVQPRMIGFLSNLRSGGFLVYEDPMKSLDLSNGTRVIVTATSQEWEAVSYQHLFIPIICSQRPAEMVNKFDFENKLDFSLSTLEKATALKPLFLSPMIDPPLFVETIQSPSASRNSIVFDINNLQNCVIQSIAAEVDGVLNKTDFSICPTVSTIHLLIVIALANHAHLPLYLEGQSGVGKSLCVESYYQSTSKVIASVSLAGCTVQSLLGTKSVLKDTVGPTKGLLQTIFSSKIVPKVLVIRQMDKANPHMIEVIHCLVMSCLQQHDFEYPGYEIIHLPKDLNIVILSDESSSVPSISSLCLYYRDIDLYLSELGDITEFILHDCTQYSHDSFQLVRSLLKSFFSVSLHSIQKVKHLCQSDPSIPFATAMWVVFGSSSIVETLLDIPTVPISIEKKDSHCLVNGYSTINTNCSYNPAFQVWSFITSEYDIVYKTSIALKTARPILLSGPSPSGKSFTLNQMALMYNCSCESICLYHNTCIDDLFGSYSLSFSDDSPIITYDKGPITMAMEKGSWVVLKHLHKAPAEVLNKLLQFCDQKSSITVTQESKVVEYVYGKPQGSQIQIHPSFRLFFTVSDDSLDLLPSFLFDGCYHIQCKSIANPQALQELCFAMESSANPLWFGEEESHSFYRCYRVLQGGKEENYELEFGNKPSLHDLVAVTHIPLSMEMELKEDCERKDIGLLTRHLCELLHSSPKRLNIPSVLQYLQTLKETFSTSIIGYILQCIAEVLSSDGLTNVSFLDQSHERITILKRWSVLYYFNESVSSIADIDSSSLDTVFDYSPQDPHLFFICYLFNRITEYKQYFHVSYIGPFIDDVEDMLDSVKNADTVIAMINSALTIIVNAEWMEDIKEAYQQHITGGQFHSVLLKEEETIAMIKLFPQVLQNHESVQTIQLSIQNIVQSVKNSLLSGVSAEDDSVYFQAIRHSSSHHIDYIESVDEVFQGSIDFTTFRAISGNDSDYVSYSYDYEEGKLLVKASHLLYKLQHYDCPAIILSEYADVLTTLHLSFYDILKRFADFEQIREHIVILVNALLAYEIRTTPWKVVVKNYHDVPIYMPKQVTRSEFTDSMDILIDSLWYDSYVSNLHNEKKKKEQLATMKNELTTTFFSKSSPVSITLVTPSIIQAIDSGMGCEKFSMDQFSVVESTWKVPDNTKITEGEIPIEVMGMEYMVLYPKKCEHPELLEKVWSSSLSMSQKLAVICPRKQTIQGSILLDMLQSPVLREQTETLIGKTKSIESVVNAVLENERKEIEEYKRSRKCEEIEKRIEGLKRATQEKYRAMINKRNEIINNYRKRTGETISYTEIEKKSASIPEWNDWKSIQEAYEKHYLSMKEECDKLASAKEEISQVIQKSLLFFFPSIPSSQPSCSYTMTTPHVGLVVLDREPFLCLPPSNTITLPERILGVDSDVIQLPYILGGKKIKIQASTSQCDVTVEEDYLTLRVNDSSSGSFTISLEITVLTEEGVELKKSDKSFCYSWL